MVGQPLGPLSRALPGRTRAGLTAICGLTAWTGGWLVGGSSPGGGGEPLRELVITHSQASPASTWTLPSVSAGSLVCAVSVHESVAS